MKYIIICLLSFSIPSAFSQVDSTQFCKKWHFGKVEKLKKNISFYFPAKTPWAEGIVEQYFQFNMDGTIYWSTQGKPYFSYSGKWKLSDKGELTIEFEKKKGTYSIFHLTDDKLILKGINPIIE